MPPDIFTITGNFVAVPLLGDSQGFITCSSKFEENVQVNSATGRYSLSDDAAVDVEFPAGITAANVLMISAVGGVVTARVTWSTSSTSTQAVPVDPMLHLISRTEDITAITLQRSPGIETFVEVYIGQVAT